MNVVDSACSPFRDEMSMDMAGIVGFRRRLGFRGGFGKKF